MVTINHGSFAGCQPAKNIVLMGAIGFLAIVAALAFWVR